MSAITLYNHNHLVKLSFWKWQTNASFYSPPLYGTQGWITLCTLAHFLHAFYTCLTGSTMYFSPLEIFRVCLLSLEYIFGTLFPGVKYFQVPGNLLKSWGKFQVKSSSLVCLDIKLGIVYSLTVKCPHLCHDNMRYSKICQERTLPWETTCLERPHIPDRKT